MIKIVTNNIGLKILALVFAAFLWLVVVNIEDPEITRSFLVSVSIENEDVIEEAGKVYEILGDSDSVRVTVTAKRKTMDKLSASDFQAVADFNDLTEDELEGVQELQIYITTLRYTNQVSISSRVKYLEVNIEEEEEKTVEVTPSYTGTPADGYLVDTITANPEKVTVSGPETVVSKISYAQAEVDVTSMSSDVDINADVVLYDESGEVIADDRLTIDSDTVKVSIVFSEQKTVKLTYSTEGTPASGYEVVDVSGNVSEVSVRGAGDEFEGLDFVIISGYDLNVDGQSQTVTKTLSIADYLPDGVSLAEGEPEEVTVTISIEPYSEKTLTINTSNIDVSGLSSDDYTIEESSVSVTVSAPEDVISSIDSGDIEMSMDLSDYSDGTHTVTVDVTLPDDVELADDVTVTVVIDSASDDNEE
ncbi:MAG: hypothetical protein K6G40_01950 [Eubacterium sp.]|nr:hypothetical protein [Eubacterium sp.]